jgi:hypothetical protein
MSKVHYNTTHCRCPLAAALEPLPGLMYASSSAALYQRLGLGEDGCHHFDIMFQPGSAAADQSVILVPTGDISPAHMPWVLRIAHVSTLTAASSDSQSALAEISRGISAWRASLNRGLLPDDEAIQQLINSNESFTQGHTGGEGRWRHLATLMPCQAMPRVLGLLHWQGLLCAHQSIRCCGHKLGAAEPPRAAGCVTLHHPNVCVAHHLSLLLFGLAAAARDDRHPLPLSESFVLCCWSCTAWRLVLPDPISGRVGLADRTAAHRAPQRPWQAWCSTLWPKVPSCAGEQLKHNIHLCILCASCFVLCISF